MIKKLYFLLALLLLGVEYVPNLNAVDLIGPQWFYLSIINSLALFVNFILFKKETVQIYYSEISSNKFGLSLLAFVFLNLLSIFVSENIPEGLITTSNYFLIFITFFHFNLIFKKLNTNREKIHLYLILFLIVGELYLSVQPILKDFIEGTFQYGDKSYYGLGANLNITAYAFLIKIPVLIYFFYTTKNKSLTIIFSSLIFFSVLSILSLGTRSALIVLISTLILLTFFLRKYIKKTILLISVFIVPIIILNIVSDSYSEDLIRDNSKIFSQKDSSISLRKRFYLDALNTIIERPIFGIGAGNWKLTSINLDKDRIKDYQVPYHVHNDFLQIAAEAGIFSMIFYIFFCLSPIFIYFLKYRGNTFEFGFEEIFLFMLPMMIFVFDSSINFPIARPINIIFYSFHLAYLIQKEK